MVSKLVTSSIVSTTSTDLTLESNNDVKLQAGTGKKVKFKVGASGSEMSLPSTDGTSGQFMKTDGSGNLDFATVDTSVDQTSLKNTVSLPGTTYNSLKLIRVWDFHNNLPPSNLQAIYASSANPGNMNEGMYVPTSMASTTDKITKFVIKFDNLNWAYNSTTNETSDIRLDMFVKPMAGNNNQGGLIATNTSFESYERYVWLNSNANWTYTQYNVTNGQNGEYTISGAYNNYLKRSQVGYRFLTNNGGSMFYSMEGGAKGSRPVQGVTYPFKEASAKNNLMRSDFSGTLEIFNRKDGWDITGDFTYQKQSGQYNNGYLSRAYTRHMPYYGSTSTYYPYNTDHARGVDLYMIPYDFSAANNGSNGSNGQILTNSFGLSGGRIELWADISN
tara:strand:+ start:807 stop:1973 length:1167 start_codon:yes stop_codon:yes gene_type:complete